MQLSPLAFYQAVELALDRRQLPQIRVSRVEYREAGALSAHREYLHIRRERLVFDVCAAPYGRGFFVSWWLAEPKLSLPFVIKWLIVAGLGGAFAWIGMMVDVWTAIASSSGLLAVLLIAAYVLRNRTVLEDFVMALPGLGGLYGFLFQPLTYFRYDTRLMFQQSVHNAVLEVVDAFTFGKGLRQLSEAERVPMVRDWFRKDV
jgi:hypothetical protein